MEEQPWVDPDGFWAEALAELEDSIEQGKREWAARALLAYPEKEALRDIAETLRMELASNAVEVNSITGAKQFTVAKSPMDLVNHDTLPMEDSLCVFTVGMEKPLAVADLISSPFTQGHAAQKWVRAWASVPIWVDGFTAGTICALELSDPRPWTGYDQICIERAANRIEVIVNDWLTTTNKYLI